MITFICVILYALGQAFHVSLPNLDYFWLFVATILIDLFLFSLVD